MDLAKLWVLDGASGTLLEEKGVVPHPTLWSAIALVNNKPAVESMHKEYYDAGANIAMTVTYQASFEGFKTVQSDEETRKTFAESVTLARSAAKKSSSPTAKFVAASLGPYGAYLSQGQEYSGDYGNITDEALLKFHRPRLEAILNGNPDVVLFETIPTLQETKVISKLVESLGVQVPVWISFSVKSQSVVTLADGTSLEKALDQCSNFECVGANCFPLANVNNVLSSFQAKTSKPLIVYPNSGEVYDPIAKVWTQPSSDGAPVPQWEITEWYSRGARVIGACCRSNPAHIRKIAQGSASLN